MTMTIAVMEKGTEMRLIDADALRGPLMAFDSKVLDIVDNAPTIDPVKHGAWVKGSCSICGEDALLDDVENEFLSKYCPCCGARMDGGTEDDR